LSSVLTAALTMPGRSLMASNSPRLEAAKVAIELGNGKACAARPLSRN
jgi:hypothetical protein